MKSRKSTNILKIIPICFLLGCSDNAPTISVKLFPARLDEGNSSDPPSGWRRVDYAGGERAGSAVTGFRLRRQHASVQRQLGSSTALAPSLTSSSVFALRSAGFEYTQRMLQDIL